MKRLLIIGLFVILMADVMFGWGLGVGPGLSIKNAALYLIVVLLALEFAFTRQRQIFELPALHLLFWLLIALAAFSWLTILLIGFHPGYRSLQGLMALKGRMIDYYLFFAVFMLCTRNLKDFIFLQRWILVVIALANIVTVLDAYNMPDLNVIELRRGIRVQGPLGEANQYGLFVAMFLPILAAQVWLTKGLWRVFFMVSVLFTFWVLVMTVSRGAYFSLFAGSVIATLYLKQHLNARYVAYVTATACVSLFAVVLVVGQEYTDLITGRTVEAMSHGDSYEVSSGRTWIWSSALQTMMSQPFTIITGYGWNTFRGAIGIAPHNTYLHYFFELGLFGALLFIAIMCGIVRHAKRAIAMLDSSGVERLNLIGFAFGFCVLMVGITFVDLTNAWYFIWAYAGLAMKGAALALRGDSRGAESAIVPESARDRGTDPFRPPTATLYRQSGDVQNGGTHV